MTKKYQQQNEELKKLRSDQRQQQLSAIPPQSTHSFKHTIHRKWNSVIKQGTKIKPTFQIKKFARDLSLRSRNRFKLRQWIRTKLSVFIVRLKLNEINYYSFLYSKQLRTLSYLFPLLRCWSFPNDHLSIFLSFLKYIFCYFGPFWFNMLFIFVQNFDNLLAWYFR
jgi:hypothetical protein